MNFPDSAFWNYSIQIYQTPDVEQACLNLQNEFNADVNIILFCLWMGEQKRRLSLDEVLVLTLTSAPWQDAILKPLRNARKTMKQHIIAMPPELLDQTMCNMREMELNAEHMQQLELEKTLDLANKPAEPDMSAVEVTTGNLIMYFKQLESVSSLGDVNQEITALLNAVFQDVEAVQTSLMSHV